MSPSIDPPVVKEDGSTAKTATFFPIFVKCKPRVSIKVDFPTPGVPVKPIFNAVLESFLSFSRISLD